MVSQEDFDLEINHLFHTIQNISKKLDIENEHFTKILTEYNKKLREIGKSGSGTLELSVKELESFARDNNLVFSEKIIKELKYQIKNPYFSRLIFKPDLQNSELDIYIGRYSYMKNPGMKMIVDWRSPIASLYYNNISSNSKCSYEFDIDDKKTGLIDRKKIEGSLNLRRQFNIESGKIKDISDSTEELNVLDKVLEEKKGGVLETIIESIQAEQDHIIRSNINIPIIVQGTAGSGKTTIAIHKISYLLYTHSKLLNEKNILLLINSPTLKKYIQSALRDLDIDKPNISTLKMAVINKLEQFTDGYKYAPGDEITDESFEYNSKNIINNLMIYVDNLASGLVQDTNKILVKYRLDDYEITNDAPIFENITNLLIEIEKLNDDLFTIESEKPIPNFERPIFKRLRNAYESLNNLKSSFKLISEFNKFLVLHKLYIPRNSKEFLYYLYIFAEYLWGENIPGYKFNFVLVDEGQDYSILEYEVIKRLAYKGRVNIFGDIYQNTNNNGILHNWDDVIKVWANQNEVPKFFNLAISYRNTKQITEFNKSILCKFFNSEYIPNAYNRDGIYPNIISFSNKNEMLKQLLNDLMILSRVNLNQYAL